VSRFSLAVMLVFAAVAAEQGAAATPPSLPTGAVLEDVRCTADPAFSYSLYLPSGYTAARRWPVLYVFSPAGRGVVPVRSLAAAAEQLGYIVVGSNDARNGPWEQIFAAQRALWKEVNGRFAVDPRRSYATGFSGGARAAVELALKHRGHFAGLILCGGVFSPQTEFPDRGGLVVVGLVGDSDLNLEEHLRSEQLLAARGYPVWQEVFVGGHRWPDSELYGSGLELLEVDAMRRGLRERDDAFIAAVAERRLGRARAFEQAGQTWLALHELRQVSSFFTGTEAAAGAGAAAARLAATPEAAAAQAAEGDFVADLRALNDWRDDAPLRAAARRMQARSAGAGRMAERARLVLHLLSIFLNDAGTRLLLEGKVKDALGPLDNAAWVYPANALAEYNAACAWARAGERDRAIRMLEAAARNRFNDPGLLDRDPDLGSLRDQKAFAGIRATVAANKEQGLAPERYEP
jgi:dienelactone hydrolase